MKNRSLELLKEWWSNCPNKKVVNFFTLIFLFLISIYSLYQIGYAVGKFAYHLGIGS